MAYKSTVIAAVMVLFFCTCLCSTISADQLEYEQQRLAARARELDSRAANLRQLRLQITNDIDALDRKFKELSRRKTAARNLQLDFASYNLCPRGEPYHRCSHGDRKKWWRDQQYANALRGLDEWENKLLAYKTRLQERRSRYEEKVRQLSEDNQRLALDVQKLVVKAKQSFPPVRHISQLKNEIKQSQTRHQERAIESKEANKRLHESLQLEKRQLSQRDKLKARLDELRVNPTVFEIERQTREAVEGCRRVLSWAREESKWRVAIAMVKALDDLLLPPERSEVAKHTHEAIIETVRDSMESDLRRLPPALAQNQGINELISEYGEKPENTLKRLLNWRLPDADVRDFIEDVVKARKGDQSDDRR
ncbi:MAG: hypothetical protein HY913_12945 [Desulfomonile tiedjei]|nr:hypothetical protein [Desulfomonile tiedjei]